MDEIMYTVNSSVLQTVAGGKNGCPFNPAPGCWRKTSDSAKRFEHLSRKSATPRGLSALEKCISESEKIREGSRTFLFKQSVIFLPFTGGNRTPALG